VTTTHLPVTAVIITRDRVTYAEQCLNALVASAGIGDIHIVDHGSTYEPMLTWLGVQAGEVESTRYGWDGQIILEKKFRQHVHWLPNQHPRDIWAPDNVLAKIIKPGQRFIVTDHDVVVPYEAAWVNTLHALLDERPDVVKAGLQLAIDDLPPELPATAHILEWEANYRPPRATWKIPDTFGSPGWVQADVDTTVALYRGLEPFALGPALRTVGRGVQAHHLSWYVNPDHLDDEQRWYAQRAAYGHWRAPDGFVDEHGLVAP
jgi:hypothetical protein